MRHIAALPEDKVPRDSEFKFRERSDVLVKKWHQILNATKGANGEPPSNPRFSTRMVTESPSL